MKIKVNACGIEEGREFAVVTVDIEDENCVLLEVQIEPELNDDGEAIDIRSSGGEDDIELIECDDCFVSASPYEKPFTKDIVPLFYNNEGENADGNCIWVMKEEVQEAVLEAINIYIKNSK